MGNAAIRTVIDPTTGETIDLMAVFRHGKVRFQRVSPVPRSPRAQENRANFAEAATRAYGMKMTGSLPPAAELVQERRSKPYASYSENRKEAEREERQRRYRDLLGAIAPEMEEELGLRHVLATRKPLMLPEVTPVRPEDLEKSLRERISMLRLPGIR